MSKRFNIVLLISIIMIFSLSSVVMAADNLPDVEENMSKDEIKTTAMMFYSAYLQDNSVKKEIKILMDELQKESDNKLSTYYSKTEYKNDNPVPNVMINKLNKTLDDKYNFYILIMSNPTNQKINLNPGITKITGITPSSSQLKAYNYYDPGVPKELTKNMLKETTIYPGSRVAYTVIFPYTDKKLETFYIDPIIYEDGHREEIKIQNLY